MTPEQCLALVAADTRVREAARDVVRSWHNKTWFNEAHRIEADIARLAVALAEFDKAMEEQK